MTDPLSRSDLNHRLQSLPCGGSSFLFSFLSAFLPAVSWTVVNPQGLSVRGPACTPYLGNLHMLARFFNIRLLVFGLASE